MNHYIYISSDIKFYMKDVLKYLKHFQIHVKQFLMQAVDLLFPLVWDPSWQGGPKHVPRSRLRYPTKYVTKVDMF